METNIGNQSLEFLTLSLSGIKHILLLMAEILHQLIDSFSHYL